MKTRFLSQIGKLLSLIVFGYILVLMTVPVNATMIGDTVTLFREVDGSTITGPFTFQVVAGDADVQSMTSNIPPNLLVDVEASSILIDFIPPFSGGGSAVSSHHLHAQGLDWVGNPAAFISGVTFSTDIPDFTMADLSFTGHELRVDLHNISPIGNSTVDMYLDVNLQFSGTDVAVPEPSTMLLLGSGLIGLVGYGRKKLFKK
jgi:hypothetical protein